MSPFTWTTSTRPGPPRYCAPHGADMPATRTMRRRRTPSSRRSARPSPTMQVMEVADFCSTSHVVIVAGKGRRREDDGYRRARCGGRPRRAFGSRRRSGGQVRTAGDVRRAHARLRRGRARRRRAGPLPHARCRARRLSRVARHEAHLQTPRGVGRARGRGHGGAGHEGHPGARQGEVDRGIARRRSRHRRRARRRARDHVLVVGAWAARRGQGRAGAEAGARRCRSHL